MALDNLKSFDKYLLFFDKYLSIFVISFQNKLKMEKRTKVVLSTLHVIAWILFLGLCVKTGSILYSFFVSLAINPEGAKNLNMGLNLSNLRDFSVGHYVAIVSLIICLTGLKAFIFYLVIKIFQKINFVHPFSRDVSALISRISYVALGIGLLTLIVHEYCDWLATKNISFPNMQAHIGTAGEFLMLGAAIFMIAQIFKRGIEIQSENELTV